ncbi:MAG TPA: hypothetical protein VGE98_04730 [Thermoanaerobaculia bacterium]
MESATTRPGTLRRWMLVAGAASGAGYGLLARLLFAKLLPDSFGVMAAAFLFLVPFVLGFVTVFLGESAGRWSWPVRLFYPWIPALLALACALAIAWEGIICIFLWLPLVLVMSLLGGLVAGLLWPLRRRSRSLSGTLLLGCALRPYGVAPLARRRGLPREVRLVPTEITIRAPRDVVWRNIERVPAIRPDEQTFALTHLIGFPKPIEATLSHEGVGGIRHATFEGGVLFVETVTAWEPGRRLAFTIRADTANIPSRTLDEHVTVGGPFFDVLSGEYRLEPIDARTTVLHLSSRHRLSTQLNGYAGLWTTFILRDTQDYILRVIRKRCEREVG